MSRFVACVQVVQSAAGGGFDELAERLAVIPELVPLHACLCVVAVGCDLHRGTGAVLVEGADTSDELFLCSVSPEFEFVLLDGVHAEFRTFPGAHALGPHVSQQAVGEQPKVMRIPVSHCHGDDLGAITFPAEHDLVLSGRDVRIDGSGDCGARRDSGTIAAEFEQHLGQRHVTFVAHITDQHVAFSRMQSLECPHPTEATTGTLFVHRRRSATNVCDSPHAHRPSLAAPVRKRSAMEGPVRFLTGAASQARQDRHGVPLCREVQHLR